MFELIAKIFCAVEIARTSAVGGNRHCVFCSFLGDFHVTLFLGMTFGAVAITAMPFEQFIRSIAVRKSFDLFGGNLDKSEFCKVVNAHCA